MIIRNAFIGIAIGLIIVAVIKPKDASTTDPPSALSARTVAATSPSVGAPQLVASGAKNPKPGPVMNESPEPMLSKLALKTAGLDDPGFVQHPSRLKDLLRISIENAQTTTPSQSELDEFEQLFFATLRRSESWEQLQLGWSQAGWDLTRWQSGDDKFVAVHEESDQRRGRGIYIIRVGTQSQLVLQAPHRFYDTQTGLLTRKLFVENDVLAAAWNTVHREQFDLAHRSDHYINAMTRALLRSNPKLVIAQIHGFANEKQTLTARTASVILSDTTRYPGRLVQRAAETLKETWQPEAVCLYPVDVAQLGGTQNQQARVFHNMGRTGFLHVELNQPTRVKLTSEASARSEFFSALTDAVSGWYKAPNR